MKNIITGIILSLILSSYSTAREFRTHIIKDVFRYNEQSPKAIALSELKQGGAKVDCIPAIDKPQFSKINSVTFLHDEDVMMIVDYNGVQKAYPRKIMQMHEIVNDYFDGKPVAMTYCPLCATSVAFIPIVDGQRVEFGVSGVLHNSDLVMYDRKTRSLWGQITGRSIVGPKTGTRLKMVGVSLLSWKEVKQVFPESLVLLPPSNQFEKYRDFHYLDYSQSDKVMFPVAAEDARLNAKQIVFGLEIDGQYIAYEESYLKKRSPLVETFGPYTLQVSYQNGRAVALDKKSGKSFGTMRVYWFAWYAFHPETRLRN